MTPEQFSELVAAEGLDAATERFTKDAREALAAKEADINRRLRWNTAGRCLYFVEAAISVVLGVALVGCLLAWGNACNSYQDEEKLLNASLTSAKTTAETYRVRLLEAHVDPETGKRFDK